MSNILHFVRAPLAMIAALALQGVAAAQTVAGPPQGAAPPPDRNSLTIGLGGGIGPDYEGSNETSFQPGGVVQGQVDGFDFQVRGTNLYVDLLRDAPRARTALTLGPVVQVRLERTGKIRALPRWAIARRRWNWAPMPGSASAGC
jgi:outer membrane protein